VLSISLMKVYQKIKIFLLSSSFVSVSRCVAAVSWWENTYVIDPDSFAGWSLNSSYRAALVKQVEW